MRQVTLGYQARLNGIMATLGMNGGCDMAIAAHGAGGLDHIVIGGGECAAALPLQDQLRLVGAWRGASRLNVHFARRTP
jgi:hypothetical protein